MLIKVSTIKASTNNSTYWEVEGINRRFYSYKEARKKAKAFSLLPDRRLWGVFLYEYVLVEWTEAEREKRRGTMKELRLENAEFFQSINTTTISKTIL